MSKMIVVLFAVAVFVASFVPVNAQGIDVPEGTAVISGYGTLTLIVGTPTVEARIGVFVTVHCVSSHTVKVLFKGTLYTAAPQQDLVLFMAMGDTMSLTAPNGPAHVEVISSKTGNAINLDKKIMLPLISR